MNIASLLELLHLREFVSFDLETTGLDAKHNKITEISAYKFKDGKPSENFTSLVNPKISIPKDIVELTGISDEMVKNAPTIEEVLPQLTEFIDDLPIVGHNVHFDIGFLKFNLEKSKLPYTQRSLYDTVTLARAFMYFNNEFNLSAVSQYFGFNTENAHRASADTLNTGNIFVKLVQECASYPLTIIQKIYNVISHTNIPNIELFKHIVEASAERHTVSGLTQSVPEINFENTSHIYTHTSNSETDLPSTPETYFEEGGVLQQNWTGYEPRPSQVSLTKDSFDSFMGDGILIAEAGTGLGKSLAYISAGLIASKKLDIPLVISTYTKNLQDQLFHHDIPEFAQTIDQDVSAVIVKGRNNYLCKTRLEWVIKNSSKLLSEKDCEDILPVLIWSEFTKSGEISECKGFRKQFAFRVWKLIRSETGFCTSKRCNRHNGCFLKNVREDMNHADIIIVNHFLLMSDANQSQSNLPERFIYVIDEGHNLVLATRDQLTDQIGEDSFNESFTFFKRKHKIFSDTLSEIVDKIPNILPILDELERNSKDLKSILNDFFQSYLSSKKSEFEQSDFYETNVRYTNALDEFIEVSPIPDDIINKLKKYYNLAMGYSQELQKFKEELKGTYLSEVSIQIGRLEQFISVFSKCFTDSVDTIMWSSFIRSSFKRKVFLNNAPLQVNSFIADNIFSRENGGIICSATLTVEDSFSYIKETIGLDKVNHFKNVDEKLYHSPFHYEDQVSLFALKSDLNANSSEFLRLIANQIDEITQKYKKRMLVLCTSYKQTKVLKDVLHPKMFQLERRLLVQTPGANRRALVQNYLDNPQSILIGTSSFWEGVDFQGDKVEILMIVKIPFGNPSDPLVSAQIDLYNSEGRNAFMKYQIPEAAVKFKQGFGRLIRSLEDSGICILTDPRLLKSRYGHVILDSLPVDVVPYSSTPTIFLESQSKLGY